MFGNYKGQKWFSILVEIKLTLAEFGLWESKNLMRLDLPKSGEAKKTYQEMEIYRNSLRPNELPRIVLNTKAKIRQVAVVFGITHSVEL